MANRWSLNCTDLCVQQIEHGIHGARDKGNEQEYCLAYIIERNQE